MAIKVYEHEKNLGIAELVTAQITTASATAAIIPNESPTKLDFSAIAKDLYSKDYGEYMAKYLPPDIMQFNCILATTNWNGNDDVFGPEETWAARYSGAWKPANINHIGREGVGNQTIGVMQYTTAVDDNYKSIYLDSSSSKPPDKFHILATVTLWEKYWPEATAKIRKGIDKNKMFVSMECLFDDFGYALRKSPTSEVNLLPRNEITAWLSSSLRAYKGKGSVKIDGETYQIGRWLRNFIFSGVGCVENPANPESIIFQDYSTHATASAMVMNKVSEESAKSYVMSQNLENNSKLGVYSLSKGAVQLWPNK